MSFRKENRILFLIICIIFLFSVEMFSQSASDSSSVSDSTQINEVSSKRTITWHMLNNPELYLQTYYSVDESALELNYASLYYQETEKLSKEEFKYKLQNDLKANLSQALQWKTNTKLGFVEKVLGYAVSATAAGMAVYHVSKYGNEYFKGKKKK